MRLPGMGEAQVAVMPKRADVLVDASDTNYLFAMANLGLTREILSKPALAKQGVSFGVRRISPAGFQVVNIYLSQRRGTGEIQTLVDKTSADAIAGAR